MAFEFSGAFGLLAGEAFGGLGGELVDIGEDRLGQEHQRLRSQARLKAQRGQAAPGDAGAAAVGGEQRIERAAGADLAAPEVDGDGAAIDDSTASELDELGERALDAASHGSGAARERAGVLGDFGGDRGDDLLGQRRQVGRKRVGLVGKLCDRHKFSMRRPPSTTRIMTDCDIFSSSWRL